MSDLSDLLRDVADSGKVPADDQLNAVINMGYGRSGGGDDKQHIVRALRKCCYEIATLVRDLDHESAHELAEAGTVRFANYSKGAGIGLDPSALADEIGRHPEPTEPQPDVRRLDTSPVQKILAKAALTDRPIPDSEIARLDLSPSVSHGEARKRLQEAAARVRTLYKRGDVAQADQLATKLGARIGQDVLDTRQPWPVDEPVADNNPSQLADLVRGGGAA